MPLSLEKQNKLSNVLPSIHISVLAAIQFLCCSLQPYLWKEEMAHVCHLLSFLKKPTSYSHVVSAATIPKVLPM